MPVRSHLRDQRVIYVNGYRWQTSVLHADHGQRLRATYVTGHIRAADGVTVARIPAAWITATAGMHRYL